MNTPKTISLPQGVRDILPEEALKIERAAAGIGCLFTSYGFEKIITPLLEYEDTLALGMGGNLMEQVLKFIDPFTGRVLAMRPDITPQVARLAATRMKKHPLPLKLYYNDNAIRYVGHGRRKLRQIPQIGAEFISEKASPRDDANMIIMAIEALQAVGLRDFKIDIGDVSFLKNILSGLAIERDLQEEIQEAVGLKDNSALRATLDKAGSGINADDKKRLIEIPGLFGGEEVLKKAHGLFTNKAALAVITNLSEVFAIIRDKGLAHFVTIDLGEARGFDYYTGVIFEGFAAGFGKPLFSGGRYDHLLEKYGSTPRAATGFAFETENVVAAMELVRPQ
ncbi:MAG: ATP phosphoribosyltransferase regulatory subunit [Thermodesulfobacteriota bacterium]